MKTKQRLRYVLWIVLIPLLSFSQQNETNKMHVITFNKYKEYTSVGKGFWTATIEDNKICIELTDHKKSKKQTYLIVNCFNKNELKSQSNSIMHEIKRLAGTLHFIGDFSKNKGEGTFAFARDNEFETFLKKEGYDITDELYYFKLFLGDIPQNYITGLKALGYRSTIRELGRLVYHDVNLEYIKTVSKLFKNDISLEMISKFSVHNVTVSYIKSLQNFNIEEIEPNQIKQFAIHDISVENIQALVNLKFEDLTFSEIKKAKIHNVTPNFIKNVRKSGYNSAQLSDYTKLKIHNKYK